MSLPFFCAGGGIPGVASIASVPLLSTAVTSSVTSALPCSSAGPVLSLPSLSSLLAGSVTIPSLIPPPATKAPLILSPALPPVPGKVVEKIKSGAYVDFKEFFTDNIQLLQRLQELSQAGTASATVQPIISGSRLREVAEPAAWASCFLAFLGTRVEHKETRELAAYGMVVMYLAMRYKGSGWLLYDRQFRQHQAAGANLPWADISTSILAATVLGRPGEGGGRSCSLCLAADHAKEECALASLEAAKVAAAPPTHRLPSGNRQARRPAPYHVEGYWCYRYNRSGYCNSSSCKFPHVCSFCHRQGHPEVFCHEKNKLKGKSGSAESKPPPSSPGPSVPRQR